MELIANDTEICKFDGVTTTTVYLGGMSELVNINDKLKWHNQGHIGLLGLEIETLTLEEVVNQLKNEEIINKQYSEIITVIIDSSLNGSIWQYGNYRDGKWHQIGTTIGYA